VLIIIVDSIFLSKKENLTRPKVGLISFLSFAHK
jgi:hypothetical protein